jgi:hypothetical protein
MRSRCGPDWNICREAIERLGKREFPVTVVG